MALKEFEQLVNEIDNSNKLSIINNDNENKNIISKESLEIEINNFDDGFYKQFKILGIRFCIIGRNLCFGFDKNNNPFFVIGPHWYLFLLMNIIICSLTIFMYKTLLKLSNSIFTIGYFISLFFVLICYYISFLINPGIVLNRKLDDENTNYCSKCKVYYKLSSKVNHCNLCEVCIEGFDHHCVWVGKCIGKKNIKPFYGIIVSVGITYIFLIITFVIIYINKKNEKNNNKKFV